MEYTVDAGVLTDVRETSARAAALLVLQTCGDRAQFPIVVHERATGETFVFDMADCAVSPSPAPAEDEAEDEWTGMRPSAKRQKKEAADER